MDKEIEVIQRRLNEYQVAKAEAVRQFHDEQTMSYFSDRFGHDHPLSKEADRGVRIQQQLIRMRERIREFAAQFTADFPPLDL